MTLLDEPVVESGVDAEAWGGPEPAPVEAPVVVPASPDGPDPDAPPPLAAVWRPVLAAALASASAGLVCGGIFGSWGARLTGMSAAFAGAGYALVAQRSVRKGIIAQAFPLVAVAVAAATLVPRGESPGELIDLARQAIESGRLFSPPVPYDAGWTPVLTLIISTISFASAWVATEFGRARLAVAIPLPLTGLAALTQPDDGEFVAGLCAFLPVLAALSVLFRGDVARSNGLGSEFELKRAVRSAALSVPLIAGLVVLSSTSFLFPEPVYDPTNEPQKPKPIPLSAANDRVLFEVRTDDQVTGPWRAGVLDVYDENAWKLPPYDRARWEPIGPSGALDPLRADAPRLSVIVVVRDLGDTSVIPTLAGTNTITGDLSGFVHDPRPGVVRVKEGRVPPALTYTMSAPVYPTEDQLRAVTTTSGSGEFAEQLIAPPMPALVRDLLASVDDNPWSRLERLRQTLLDNVTASGAGSPDEITPDRMVELLQPDSTGNPFEIVATEAILARWAGIPSRIGFGFDGLNSEDGTSTVRPRNSAQWLEVHWPGFGWVPLIGAPKQAAASLDDDLTRFDPEVVTGSDVAVEVFLPFKQQDLQQTYERIRNEILFWSPLIISVALAWVAWPVVGKAHRRAKRRRWAAAAGPAQQIAVEYSEFRDLATDLNIGDVYSTPLEFVYIVRDDVEHEHFAWLHARSLYGDLRDAGEADVRAAETMGASLRRRLSRGQPVLAQVGAMISRASLHQPYSDEVPNIRVPRLPASSLFRRRRRPRGRTGATRRAPGRIVDWVSSRLRRLLPARSS